MLPMLFHTRPYGVHLLTYAAPVIKKMLPFNNLTFYTVPAMPPRWTAPSWLTIELGIFAGRLYFGFEEYIDLRVSLGVDPLNGESIQRPIFASTVKVLPFLQDWLALRRRGQDFSHTPVGFVCQDKPLTPDHPFFRALDLQHSPDNDVDADEGLARQKSEDEGEGVVEDGDDGLEGYGAEEYGGVEDGGFEDREAEDGHEDYEGSKEDAS